MVAPLPPHTICTHNTFSICGLGNANQRIARIVVSGENQLRKAILLKDKENELILISRLISRQDVEKG